MRDEYQNLVATIPADLVPALEAEFRRGWLMEAVKAEARSQMTAKLNQEKRKAIDGIGRMRLNIDPTYYHAYGQGLGYQCWNDKGFLNWFEKKHPEFKVNCGGTKLQVGYTGDK